MVELGMFAPLESTDFRGFPQIVSGFGRKYPVKNMRIALQLMQVWNQASYEAQRDPSRSLSHFSKHLRAIRTHENNEQATVSAGISAAVE
jgi:hypothetical protein